MLLFSRLLFLTSAPRPARARCGAIHEATLPPCSPPLLQLPGPALPLVCSFSLVLPCPLSQAPGSPALCLLVPVLPLLPRHTLRGAIREASLPLPLHLAAPWCPGPWACGTHVALHSPAAFVPLRPPCLPLPPPPFSPSDTTQDTVQACRTHVAGTHLASIGGVVGPVGTTLRPPAAATAPAGAAAAGSHSKCRGGRGPGRPRLPPGQGFTVPPAAPGRRGGSITKSCKTSKKNRYIYIYIYIYVYVYLSTMTVTDCCSEKRCDPAFFVLCVLRRLCLRRTLSPCRAPGTILVFHTFCMLCS